GAVEDGDDRAHPFAGHARAPASTSTPAIASGIASASFPSSRTRHGTERTSSRAACQVGEARWLPDRESRQPLARRVVDLCRAVHAGCGGTGPAAHEAVVVAHERPS